MKISKLCDVGVSLAPESYLSCVYFKAQYLTHKNSENYMMKDVIQSINAPINHRCNDKLCPIPIYTMSMDIIVTLLVTLFLATFHFLSK